MKTVATGSILETGPGDYYNDYFTDILCDNRSCTQRGFRDRVMPQDEAHYQKNVVVQEAAI